MAIPLENHWKWHFRDSKFQNVPRCLSPKKLVLFGSFQSHLLFIISLLLKTILQSCIQYISVKPNRGSPEKLKKGSRPLPAIKIPQVLFLILKNNTKIYTIIGKIKIKARMITLEYRTIIKRCRWHRIFPSISITMPHLPYLRSLGSTPLTIFFFVPLPVPLPPVTAAHSFS